jgi:MscS family membrane protein
VPLVRTSLQGTIIVLVLVQIATNLSGETATSIIAGLGVGGLAVGLAAQDTIKNFFGSMMIFGDRPFEMGDEISVDSLSGKVETVGFRSTRFRTGDGHVVTIPNGELANKPIVNISRRQSLQRKLELALSHEVGEEKMLAAIEIVQQILSGHEGQSPDKPPRVFFSDITPTALNLQVMYWYSPPDWWHFMALNQRVNLDILRRFEEAGIQFASRTERLRVSAEAVKPESSATAEQPVADTRK